MEKRATGWTVSEVGGRLEVVNGGVVLIFVDRKLRRDKMIIERTLVVAWNRFGKKLESDVRDRRGRRRGCGLEI